MQSSQCSQTEFSRTPTGPPHSSCLIAFHCLRDEVQIPHHDITDPPPQDPGPGSFLSYKFLPPIHPSSHPSLLHSFSPASPSPEIPVHLGKNNTIYPRRIGHTCLGPLYPAVVFMHLLYGNMRTRPTFHLPLYLQVLGHEKCPVNVGWLNDMSRMK